MRKCFKTEGELNRGRMREKKRQMRGRKKRRAPMAIPRGAGVKTKGALV
jgi:hypothetical protein